MTEPCPICASDAWQPSEGWSPCPDCSCPLTIHRGHVHLAGVRARSAPEIVEWACELHARAERASEAWAAIRRIRQLIDNWPSHAPGDADDALRSLLDAVRDELEEP